MRFFHFINWQKKIILVTILLGLSFGLSAAAQSYLPIVPCGRSGQDACTLCHLFQLISNIINFMLYQIVIPAAILLLVIAGYFYITSSGSEQRVEKAKSVLYNTILGVFIAFVAWLIVDSILKSIPVAGWVPAWSSFPGC